MASQNPEYIIEKVKCGKFLKVTAIEVETMVEVSMIAPINSTSSHIEKVVIQKLNYVKARKK